MSAKRMTPQERAESILRYAAWAVVPDGREHMIKVIARAIGETEIEAMRLGEIKAAPEPEAEWEYQMVQAVRVYEGTGMFYARLAEGWEPHLSLSDGMLIMRRKHKTIFRQDELKEARPQS